MADALPGLRNNSSSRSASIKRLLRSLTLAVLAVQLALSGCTLGKRDTADERPVIVATTTILGDLVASIAKDDFRVETLIPRGVDPHEFQASADQALLLREAVLVVANGLDLEEGLLDVLDAARDEGVPILEIGPLVDPLPIAPGSGSSQLDPHVWLDPVRMARAVELIGEQLAGVDQRRPAEEWRQRTDAYRQQILETHARIEQELATVPPERRKLVTNHAAFGYFADRYGFEVIGAVIPGGSTAGAASAAELSSLAALLRDEDIPAIFVEETAPQDVARALAREVGREVRLVTLYTGSLGADGSGAETYLGLIWTNARLIAEALR